jgi:hypothetical protein
LVDSLSSGSWCVVSAAGVEELLECMRMLRPVVRRSCRAACVERPSTDHTFGFRRLVHGDRNESIGDLTEKGILGSSQPCQGAAAKTMGTSSTKSGASFFV